MNADIEKLKENLKKKLENFEIDKKIGQFSVDSIYSMFPTESKILLDYIEQLQNNWNELNKFIDENIKSLEEEMTNKKCDNAVAIYGREMNGFFKVRRKMQELEQGKDEEIN